MGTGAIRTYTYDIGTNALGTLSRVEDASTTVSYTYDTLARKIGETRILGQQSYTLGYTYNSANILTSISYPDGGKTAYTYKNGFVE